MTKKEEILYYYLHESEQVVNLIHEKYGLEVSPEKIWQILIDHFDCFNNPADIIFKELDSHAILNIIASNYLSYLKPLFSISINYTVIPEDSITDNIIKGVVKFRGESWEVHKGDPDIFPSNPHAHNYESGLKLHLGTGDLFKKRRFVNKIKKKDLLMIRTLIQNKMSTIELPLINI